ncbi:MAG: ABC transporter permease [Microcystaceae cyanobacterium]
MDLISWRKSKQWKRLSNNTLARLGATILLIFYILVIGANFFAPYGPLDSQADGSLLPPTQIYWRLQKGEQQGKWIGPHVYPTTQTPTDLETGKRDLVVNYDQPSPLRLFVKGTPYRLFEVKLPLPPTFKEVTLFSGISVNLHFWGTTGEAKINLLGTDEQARDQLSRLLFGGRVSLFIGVIGILISFPLGMIIGGISGYFGGWIDIILMRFVEVLMTIPGIYLLVALSGFLLAFSGLTNTQRFLLIIMITSLISWTGLARVIRGQVLSLKEQEFIQAARAMGASPWRIIIKHILPQTATYMIISATLAIPGFIVAESVLSLIGLGIQQPDPSWGNLLSLATNASILVLHPWLVWSPTIVIVLTVLSFNLLGDGLRDALDPKSLEQKS